MFRCVSAYTATALVATIAVISTLTSYAPEASAHGQCKIVGYEVRDFGKVGPTADAKRLLDERIPKWAKKNGYRGAHKSGKKKVSCKLYLDVGFFDEWTCTATQRVCYFK
ncbi:MAG: hypothetical protein AAGJ70_00170 [Pseudomonadota bacterium]